MLRFATVLWLLSPLLLGACGSTPVPSAEFPASDWNYADGKDESYLLAPGDTLDVVVHSAPELSYTVKIAPDGRISVPLSGPVTAAARSVEEVRLALMSALSSELIDPDLDVIVTDFASQKIFIGGEVKAPGMQALPGQLDPLQAIIMAGGFTDRADTRQVLLMRRLPAGEVKTVKFDIHAGLLNPENANWLPLQRFDVIYVPDTNIARQNRVVQQYIRNALPIDFLFFYGLGDD